MPFTTLPLDFLDTPPEEVAARFRWARRQGHPRYVWPDVPVPVWRAGLVVIAEATARVLAEEDATGEGPVTLALPEGVDARALGVSAFTSGMGPLLGLWIEQGRLGAEEDVAALLALHLEHGRRRARRVRELLDDVAGRLAAEGIPLTLMKGIHTGLVYFPELGARPAVDIDLIVSPDDHAPAEEILSGAGYACLERWRGPVRSEWMPPGAPTSVASLEVSHRRNPLTVDLHAAYTRDMGGVCSLDFTPRSPADLVVVDSLQPHAHGLAPSLLALMIAVHASEYLEGLKLIRMVELVLISRGAGPGGVFDASAVDRAYAMGALRFAYPLVSLAEALAPGSVGQEFLGAARADAPGRMRRLVDALTPGTALGIKGGTVGELFMSARGPVEHLRRLAHLVLPEVKSNLGPADLVAFYARRALWVFGHRRSRRAQR